MRAVLGVAASQLAAGAWLLWRTPRPQPAGIGAGGPEVSVIVPARNEEAALPRLLRSLAAQTRPPEEVVVVDDGSVDRTGALAGEAGPVLVVPPPLPEGWTGKCWACHHGASRAAGEVLVFLDADVVLAPESLARLLAEQRRRGGLVSVAPFYRVRRLSERLSGVAVAVTAMGTGAFTGWPHRTPAMAFGPCLLVSREDYEAIGGHGHPEVRGRPDEDIGLAALMRSRGRPVSILSGQGLVEAWPRPEGALDLARGWTRLLAAGTKATDPLVGALVGWWVAGALSAGWRAARALRRLRGRRLRYLRASSPALGGSRVDGSQSAYDLAIYCTWAAELGWMLRRLGSFGWVTALSFPLPVAAFVALWARSVADAALGRPGAWKGRRLPRRADRRPAPSRRAGTEASGEP